MITKGIVSGIDGGYRILVGGRVSLPAEKAEHIHELLPGDRVIAFFPSSTLADGVVIALIEDGEGK